MAKNEVDILELHEKMLSMFEQEEKNIETYKEQINTLDQLLAQPHHLHSTLTMLQNATQELRTKIEDMYLNANTGKITWVPTMENLGEHVVEVAVSDGFELGKAMKAVTIFVEATPVILNEAPTEAYVGLDYVFVLEGEDALGNQEIGKDIFSNIASSSFKNYSFNSVSHSLS